VPAVGIAPQSILTSEGIRVADVIWMDPTRVDELLKFPTQPVSPAPDICVEVLSPSNTKAETDQKRALYFSTGAHEVWVCDRSNQIYFFGPDGPLDQSALCPQFNSRISLSAKTSSPQK
jgi:Uma2 family endonuclease